MVVFLADRSNLQEQRLHERVRNRLDSEFTDVHRRRAEPREAGAYRVVGTVDPLQFLSRDAYPARTARLEIGFQLQTGESYEYYWINWIEPDRGLLLGWHQDDTHEDLGPVHLQVNDRGTTVSQQPATFIDSHPLDVLERRHTALPNAILAIEWEQGRPVGIDPSGSG